MPKKQEKMKIETVGITTLVMDPANVRRHPEKNLEAIKGSLAKFGQQKPIVVGAGNVVAAGNGTLTAALALGWKEIAIVRTELTGAELVAFCIADNRTGELAEWDMQGLAVSLEGLKTGGWDLGEMGFPDMDAIERPPGDKSGASPWDRVGDASAGVVFSFGDITAKVPEPVYDAFRRLVPDSEVNAWLEGWLRESCDC